MELLQIVWNFLRTVFASLWSLAEGAGLLVWDLLVVLHTSYPRTEGLIIGVTLAWFMTRRDSHPLLKAISAPLKLVVDILDLIWDHCIEFLSDVWDWHMGHWKRLGGWIAAGYGWCKSKIVGAWSWGMTGLKSLREKLKKDDSDEDQEEES